MSCIEYQTHKTINRWCIADGPFLEVVTWMSLLFLLIKMANAIPLEACDVAALRLPIM
jgi:hypothetical protein